MILAKKYEIEEKIGSGRFGYVYRGMNIKTNTPVAIKVESTKTTTLLKHETTFLKYLHDEGVRKIPIVYWFGVIHGHSFLVMTYYDCCLYDLVKEQTIPLETSFLYMRQAISLLESIHSKQVLHRDIKSQNFMVREGELFLIDFGLATFWKDEENVEENAGVIGTPKYTSYFVHCGEPFCRRDDLISLGYLFIEWIGGLSILPWNCNGGEPKSNEEYILLKSWENLQKTLEIKQEGERFLHYCYLMKKEERPNYGGLLGSFSYKSANACDK